MISFCIPFQSVEPHRIFSKQFVVEQIDADFPEAQILVGGTQVHGAFSRSKSRNRLAKEATGDVLVFLDADSVVPSAQIAQAVYQASVRGWAFPYDVYYNLTEKGSGRLYGIYTGLPLRFSSDEYEHCFPSEGDPEPAVGGCVVVSQEMFGFVGGYDERFIGWGEEDRAFGLVLETLVNSSSSRIVGPLYHCWHPAPEEERFAQPYFHANRLLCNKYRSARGNPTAMHALINDR